MGSSKTINPPVVEEYRQLKTNGFSSMINGRVEEGKLKFVRYDKDKK